MINESLCVKPRVFPWNLGSGLSVGQDGDDFRQSRFCTNLVSRAMAPEGGRTFSRYSPLRRGNGCFMGPGDSLLLCSVVANIIGFHLRPRSSSTRQSDPKEKIEIDITS